MLFFYTDEVMRTYGGRARELEHVVIHCIGPEMKDAVGCELAWEEYFHWLPALRHLEVAFVGPVLSLFYEWPKFSK